jgi:hypothetical protein
VVREPPGDSRLRVEEPEKGPSRYVVILYFPRNSWVAPELGTVLIEYRKIRI